MLSIFLIIASLYLVITGNMILRGGKRARGNMLVRVGGGIMLVLSVFSFNVSSSTFLSILLTILILKGVIYFFAKGEDPAQEESNFNGFNSPKEQMETHRDEEKSWLLYIIVLGVMVGSILVFITSMI